MITPDLVARINELAGKQRAGSLSAEEKEEQAQLRRIYIDCVKSQVKNHFDAAAKPAHSSDCDCGCHSDDH